MRALFRWTVFLALVVGGGGYWWTMPRALSVAEIPSHAGDAEAGERIFWAAGCASCHSAAEAEGEDRLILSGGRAFPSDFGTFYAPNISMDDANGIGSWSEVEFVSAVMRGVSPQGQHYYPAFPYTTYARASVSDIQDLWAFMQTLPADPTASRAHDVGFPFSFRASLGGWKLLFFNDDWVLEGDLSEEETHGRYLVEALGHCGECHTARNVLGGMDMANWLAGAPNPTGQGRIPNITPGDLNWSQRDLANYLRDGFTPEFDVVGGEMAEVVANLAQLHDEDRAAIAAYLARVPAIEN